MEETQEVIKEVSNQQTPTGAVQREKTTVSSVPESSAGVFKAQNIVYYILGIIEILLAFRFILKVLGANPVSSFVSIIYTLSGIFSNPFSGIFRTAVTAGVETRSVFEPSTLIAMVVYAILAWGLVKLMDVLSSR